MGAFYQDGIDDKTDATPLRTYAEKNQKYIGTAISTWKNDITNASLPETKEVAAQFNMLVAENEMKFDALEPSRNQFSYWAADKRRMTRTGAGQRRCRFWKTISQTW